MRTTLLPHSTVTEFATTIDFGTTVEFATTILNDLGNSTSHHGLNNSTPYMDLDLDLDQMSEHEFQKTLLEDSEKYYAMYFKPTIQKIFTYTVMAFTGIIGNIITCVVVYTNKPLNNALGAYIFNLAVTDIMSLFWDFPLNSYFIESESLRDIRNLAAITPINVTILNITAFAVERYLFICHPNKKKFQLSTVPRAKKALMFVWGTSFMAAVPPSVNLGMVKQVTTESMTVFHVINGMDLQTAAIVLTFGFVVPMFIVCGLYARIMYEVRKFTRMLLNEPEGRNREQKPKIKNPTMLMVVTVMFIITWTPILLERFLVVHGAFIPMDRSSKRVAHSFFLESSEVMHYSSSLINPIIYSLMSKKYREGVVNTYSILLLSVKRRPSRRRSIFSR